MGIFQYNLKKYIQVKKFHNKINVLLILKIIFMKISIYSYSIKYLAVKKVYLEDCGSFI